VKHKVGKFVEQAQPEGGVQSWYQKNVICIHAFVQGLQALFQSGVGYDWRWCPDVEFSVGHVHRQLYPVVILLSSYNPMSLHKPLTFSKDVGCTGRGWLQPVLDKLQDGRML
jgi:hypothetical protein